MNGKDRTAARAHPGSVSAALAAVFNVLALNVVLVVVSLAVVTVPLAISAAFEAVYRWRTLDEDRVLRSFMLALRRRPVAKSLIAGPAVLAGILGGAESVYFIRYSGFIALVCVFIGIVTSAIAVSVLAYLCLFLATTDAGHRELWRAAFVATGRTVVLTTPVFALTTGGAVVAGLAAPALAVVAVPVLLLWAWQRIATWGARRLGLFRELRFRDLAGQIRIRCTSMLPYSRLAGNGRPLCMSMPPPYTSPVAASRYRAPASRDASRNRAVHTPNERGRHHASTASSAPSPARYCAAVTVPCRKLARR